MGKRIEKTNVLAIVLLYQIVLASSASAAFFDWIPSDKETAKASSVSAVVEGSISFEKSFNWNTRPVIEEEVEPKFKILKTYTVQASGYSSTPDQTDSTPFTTASGKHVRDGIIAANVYANGQRLPFGTLVRIPEIYGDKIFVVEDRMNIRYQNNIDIWFPERQLAKEFGRKKVVIEIVTEES